MPRMPNSRAGVPLATPPLASVQAPLWADVRALPQLGTDEYRDVFRLPNESPLIHKWVFTRALSADGIPAGALDNATTESTTVFRMELGGRISPSLSNYWIFVPYLSLQGYTIGVCFMHVVENNLDSLSMQPVKSGRFAMQDSTGEVFMTAWQDNGYIAVSWTSSVMTCERMRELRVYKAPEKDGVQPDRLVLRNALHERRDCHICGVATSIDHLRQPCTGPISRKHTVGKEGTIPYLPAIYRRFRGGYFGVCVKTLYQPNGDQRGLPSCVPVFLDIRHADMATNKKMLMSLTQGHSTLSFGLGPRVSSRLLIDMANSPGTPSTSGYTTSEHSGSTAWSPSTRKRLRGQFVDRGAPPPLELSVRRRRNVDAVERDTQDYNRICRNRVSANKSNEKRKAKIAQMPAELQHLRERVPDLERREADLESERAALREALAEKAEKAEKQLREASLLDGEEEWGWNTDGAEPVLSDLERAARGGL